MLRMGVVPRNKIKTREDRCDHCGKPLGSSFIVEDDMAYHHPCQKKHWEQYRQRCMEIQKQMA